MTVRSSGKKEVTKFFTTDIAIIDIVTQLEGNEALQKLIKDRGYMPGSKQKIDKEEFALFAAALSGVPVQHYPGGSASNMIRTMKKLAPNLVDGVFYGVLEESYEGANIRASFRDAGVDLKEVKDGVAPESAVSFVIKYPNGERIIVTYPGNAKEIMRPEIFTPESMADSDYILLQGSIASKFDHSVIDQILKNRWDMKKQLVLALPTSAFAPDYFYNVEASANIVLSNTDELGFVVGVGVKEARDAFDKDPENTDKSKYLSRCIETALRRLQEQQKRSSNKVLEEAGFEPQVAMITDGQDGAYVVTSESIDHVESIPDSRVGKIVNKLGAGDNSFAGFVFAKTILEFDNVKAAEFAMRVAAAKLRYDGPVMEKPWDELVAIGPRMASAAQGILAKLQTEKQL